MKLNSKVFHKKCHSGPSEILYLSWTDCCTYLIASHMSERSYIVSAGLCPLKHRSDGCCLNISAVTAEKQTYRVHVLYSNSTVKTEIT